MSQKGCLKKSIWVLGKEYLEKLICNINLKKNYLIKSKLIDFSKYYFDFLSMLKSQSMLKRFLGALKR